MSAGVSSNDNKRSNVSRSELVIGFIVIPIPFCSLSLTAGMVTANCARIAGSSTSDTAT